MRRTLTRGIVVACLALLGCQAQPAPTPQAQSNDPPPPPIVADATPPPPAPTPPSGPNHPTVDKFVPPFVGKAPQVPFSMEMRPLAWDLGVIPPHTKKEYKFAFKNDTQGTWTVKFVTPGCKCAIGEFTSKVIKPGETSHLAVSFSSEAREGNFIGAITVDFQEPEAPHYMLYIKAEVRRPLTAVPPTVDLGKVGPADQLSRSVELRNYAEADIAPPTVDAPPWLRVEVKPVDQKAPDNRARQTWEVVVHADPARLKSAGESGTLVVRGGDAKEPLSIPVNFKMKAPLEAIPGEVLFEDLTPGEAAERTLLLETYPELGSLTEKDLALSHDLGDEFTVEVARKLGANRFQLVARYRPRGDYASIEGELTVSVKDRAVPATVIKVRGKKS